MLLLSLFPNCLSLILWEHHFIWFYDPLTKHVVLAWIWWCSCIFVFEDAFRLTIADFTALPRNLIDAILSCLIEVSGLVNNDNSQITEERVKTCFFRSLFSHLVWKIVWIMIFRSTNRVIQPSFISIQASISAIRLRFFGFSKRLLADLNRPTIGFFKVHKR